MLICKAQFSAGHDGSSSRAAEFALCCGVSTFLWNFAKFDKWMVINARLAQSCSYFRSLPAAGLVQVPCGFSVNSEHLMTHGHTHGPTGQSHHASSHTTLGGGIIKLRRSLERVSLSMWRSRLRWFVLYVNGDWWDSADRTARPSKTWTWCDCIKVDMQGLGLSREDEQGKDQWSLRVRRKQLTEVHLENSH